MTRAVGNGAEEIVVTIPRERPFGAVAGLVLGGVAARHELTLEALDDLQLALDTLLDRSRGEGELSVVLRVSPGAIDAAVGPFGRDVVAELDREPGGALDLRRLLDAVVDTAQVSERDGGCWVELHKTVERDRTG